MAQFSLWILSVLLLSGKSLLDWLLFLEITLLEKPSKYLLIQDKCGNTGDVWQKQIRSNINYMILKIYSCTLYSSKLPSALAGISVMMSTRKDSCFLFLFFCFSVVDSGEYFYD